MAEAERERALDRGDAAFSLRSQVPVAAPPFRHGEGLQGLPGLDLDLDLEHLRDLAPLRPNSAPVADEPDGAEQVALDHQSVEPRHVQVRIDPAQDHGAADGRAGARHCARLLNLAEALPWIGPCPPAALRCDSRAATV